MKKDVKHKFDDYTVRLINENDFENYYNNGFLNCSEETDYFTGTTEKYKKEDILNYINKIVDDKTRFDFVILDNDNKIIGEVVLNSIDNGLCNYRIAIFSKDSFSKGIGYNASKFVFDYAFNNTDIERIGLEVYPFNERGLNLYKKLDFVFIKEVVDEEAEDLYRVSYYMELCKV